MKHNKGFTVVELLIATTVFSVVLLVISSGLIYIGKVYYKTTAQSKVQDATRAIVDEISQNLQFTNGDLTILPNRICVGDTGYKFASVPSAQVLGSTHALQRVSSCTGAPIDGKELVPQGMYLYGLSITEPVSGQGIYKVMVHLVSLPEGEPLFGGELFSGGSCKAVPGSEYCASVKLETTVISRL